MSGTGESTGDFAGEERAFRIRLGEIRRIEAKTDTGIGEVCRRLAGGLLAMQATEGNVVRALAGGIDLHADDVREPIYQGLIGAGMSSGEAAKLLRTEIDDRGLMGLLDNIGVSLAALVASQEAPEATEGEPVAGESPAIPKTRSRSRKSTALDPQSD